MVLLSATKMVYFNLTCHCHNLYILFENWHLLWPYTTQATISLIYHASGFSSPLPILLLPNCPVKQPVVAMTGGWPRQQEQRVGWVCMRAGGIHGHATSQQCAHIRADGPGAHQCRGLTVMRWATSRWVGGACGARPPGRLGHDMECAAGARRWHIYQ